MSPSVVLFDDARARGWEPFASTRPAGELRFGCYLQWERAGRAWGLPCSATLVEDGLVGFQEGGGPPALSAGELTEDGVRVVLSSRAVLRARGPELPDSRTDLFVEGQRVGWVLTSGEPLPPAEHLADPARAPALDSRLELDGYVLDDVWDLVERCPAQLAADLGAVVKDERAILPPGVHRIGGGLVTVGAEVEVEPGVVLDTRTGPIALDDGATVRGPARLEGPLQVGRGSTILGGSVSASAIGPACKVRGEIEKCVFLGHANKAHDGYLGHAYVGRWVNLGAFTTNSDLKNNYGDVRIRTADGEVSTGLMKVGCFLGDHVKTAIGTLLNTGTVVGAGSNLFGGHMPPKYVPPFSWGGGPDDPVFDLPRFLDTAARAMARRGVELTPGMRSVLERAWEAAAASRTRS